MATPNRTAQFARLLKVLRKHYKPVGVENRPVLEHLIFACCLENATYEAAQQGFNALKTMCKRDTGFVDWNEVRVSSVKELSEALKMLPDPAAAAQNIKKILYGVFESTWSFDIDGFRKLTLGQAQQKIKKYDGATLFVTAYVTQATLGGHAIPLDRGTLDALHIVGIAGEQDVKEGVVPGLERAVPKNKGIEVGSLLHQLGADLATNPLSPNLHKVLLEIDPTCKERLPKRRPKAAPPPPAAERADARKPAPAPPQAKKAPLPPKKAAEPPKKAPEPVKKAAAEKAPLKKEPPKPAAKKKVASLSKRKPR